MKNKTLRAAAVLMTAAIAMTSLCGCAKNGNGGGGILGNLGGNAKKGKLEVSLDHSYAGEKLNITGINDINYGMSLGDKVLLVGYDENYENQKIYLYDPVSGTSEQKEFAYLKTLGKDANGYANSCFMDSTGNFNVLFSGYSLAADENGEEQYTDLGMTLEVYDKDFNVVETRSLKEMFPEDTGINTLIANPAGGYLASMWDNDSGNQVVNIYDKDFNQTGRLNANFQYIENLYVAKDNGVYVIYEDGEGQEKFGSVDVATGSVTPIEISGKPAWTRSSFASRDEKYDIYLNGDDCLYGVNVKAGTCEPVLNWLNSDFQANYINSIVQLDDGRFLVSNAVYSRNEYGGSEMWVLSPRPADAFKDVKMISMAGLYFPDDITQAILSFNRTHNDVRIAVASYEKYNSEENPDGALKQFQTDMTSGIVADLILTNGLPYESLANKGLFLDLTDRVNSSFPASDYFTNLFDALKYGDKIYHVGASYGVETLIGKQDVVGTKSGLTTAEFLQLIKSLPAGTSAFGDMTKEGSTWSMIGVNIRNFVDVGAGSCSFNSPEFIELLELCNTFPSSEEQEKLMNDEQKYWEDQQYQYMNGKTAFSQIWINEVRSAYEQQMSQFDKAKVTRVGYPVSGSGGNGGRFSINSTVAISANSEYKDQCWEYISSMFTEEAQEELSWMMPVSRKAFDKQVQEAMKPRTYKDENGKTVEEQFTIWRGDEEIKIPNMTQAYADELKAYIEGIRDISVYDTTIMEIVNEEAQKYFAGEQTSQQAADMIQSRASLYLSEQA